MFELVLHAVVVTVPEYPLAHETPVIVGEEQLVEVQPPREVEVAKEYPVGAEAGNVHVVTVHVFPSPE